MDSTGLHAALESAVSPLFIYHSQHDKKTMRKNLHVLLCLFSHKRKGVKINTSCDPDLCIFTLVQAQKILFKGNIEIKTMQSGNNAFVLYYVP